MSKEKRTMAYNNELADRIREKLSDYKDQLEEKQMFGGLAFMLKDKMCCGIMNDDLMIRVNEDQYHELLKRPYARVMDFTGRPMTGFVYISREGYESDRELQQWIDLAVEFTKSVKQSRSSKKVRKMDNGPNPD